MAAAEKPATGKPAAGALVERTILGRTGLDVGVAGLGGGGHSRLGLATAGTEVGAIGLIHRALDRGANLIDTADLYGTEEVIGKALKDRRHGAVVVTKTSTAQDGKVVDPGILSDKLEASLKCLGTDYLDVYCLHAVHPDLYRQAHEILLPELRRLRDQGKFRFVGLTERFPADPQHSMLQEALVDDAWDVIMVGFNLLNPSARNRVFTLTRKNNVGTLNMFAVRRALSQADALRPLIDDLIDKGLVAEDGLDREDPLGFLLSEDHCRSLTEAAYRFCRHEPGVDVVLTGTGVPAHLDANLDALSREPLPQDLRDRLERLFGHIDSVTGN
jgi:L-galactose dehydrogenase